MARCNPVVQAVVFDMDGVLIDSEDIWRQVREAFAADIGQVWSAADQVSTMGSSTAEWSSIMVERMQLRTRLGMDEAGVAREIIGRMQARYREHLPQRSPSSAQSSSSGRPRHATPGSSPRSPGRLAAADGAYGAGRPTTSTSSCASRAFGSMRLST